MNMNKRSDFKNNIAITSIYILVFTKKNYFEENSSVYSYNLKITWTIIVPGVYFTKSINKDKKSSIISL